MTKLSSPLLSFGVTGTLADSLTFEKYKNLTIVKNKPVPSGAPSLAQLYNRWRYYDAIQYWNSLTASQKWSYHTRAVLAGIPRMSLFLKDYFKLPPDQVLWYRMDHPSDLTEYDFSKHSHPGIITGASPIPGIISYAKHYDGNDDWILCPYSSDYVFGLSSFSISFFVNFPLFREEAIISNMSPLTPPPYTGIGFSIYIVAGASIHCILYKDLSTSLSNIHHLPLLPHTWTSIIIVVNRPLNKIDIYSNNILTTISSTSVGDFSSTSDISSPLPPRVARGAWLFDFPYSHVSIDDLRFYNRILSRDHISTLATLQHYAV